MHNQSNDSPWMFLVHLVEGLFALGVLGLGIFVPLGITLSTESSISRAQSAAQASQLYNGSAMWLLGWCVFFLALIAAQLTWPKH